MSTKVTIDKLKTTEVFPTHLGFTAKRQKHLRKTALREPPPWTNDPILSEYRFTNVFRAADRGSQFAIRHMIYESAVRCVANQVACFHQMGLTQVTLFGRRLKAIKAEVTA
jgi:alpha-glutamyl/putrescinyl thymine pyrophosphorylase clade 1